MYFCNQIQVPKGSKGNPVKIRSYSRSCKVLPPLSVSMPLTNPPIVGKAAENRTSQKTCPFPYCQLSGTKVIDKI